MENENKTNDQPHHKKKPYHKRKGYFIDPNAHAQKSASAEGAQPNAKHEGNKQINQSKQDKKPNGNANAQREKPREQENQSAPQVQPGNPNAKKHSKYNKHKNKNKNNQAQKLTDKDDAQLQDRHGQSAPQKKQEKPQEAPSAPVFNSDDYEEVRFPAASTAKTADTVETEEPVAMVEVVGIRFKSSGKVYYFLPDGKTFHRGQHAIVETSRGQEYGEVAMGNKEVKETDTVPPLRSVIRIATEADTVHHKENKQKEEDAFRICNEKIIAHGLDMKLIDAQYTFDNSKLLFYFTSSGRVDFRDLVKDLASVFRTRIELRQIGIRDEAKLMGGMGMCGRPLCCTLFLSDFGQVSIKMAKEQNLSLNSAKISGICGRLMCCLRYEHEVYEYEIKRTPPVDALVHTADGNGTVTEINPLLGTVKVRLTASPDTPPKLYKREDVVMLQKKHNKDAEAADKE